MSGPAVDQLQELAPGAPPFSYLPQTWAWGLLLGLLLAGLRTWEALRWWRWRRDRYRREALQRLDQLAAADNRLIALRELPELLKRVALSMPGAPAVGTLGGQAWQQFLATHARQPVPANFAAQLQLLAYAPDAQLAALDDDSMQHLFDLTRQWIEAHHVAL